MVSHAGRGLSVRTIEGRQEGKCCLRVKFSGQRTAWMALRGEYPASAGGTTHVRPESCHRTTACELQVNRKESHK